MESQDLLKQFENALGQEKTIYEKILSISNRQLQLIEDKSKDAEKLAALMNEKWERIQEVKTLEESHQVIKSSWEEVYTAYSEEDRKAVSELKQTLLDLICDLQKKEDEITVGIKSQMIDINQQLLSLQKGKKSAKAYYSNRDVHPPRFFDKKN